MGYWVLVLALGDIRGGCGREFPLAEWKLSAREGESDPGREASKVGLGIIPPSGS